MRLHLTRKADYALRALIHLARRSDPVAGSNGRALGRTTIQAVADGEGIPVRFLEKIVRELAGVGLVRSIMGKNGGLELGRPAHAISFADVLEATDGPFRVAECTVAPMADDASLAELEDEALAPSPTGATDIDADALVIGYGAPAKSGACSASPAKGAAGPGEGGPSEGGPDDGCGAEMQCRMRHVWNELQRQTDRLLRGTTLADVAFDATPARPLPTDAALPASALAAVGLPARPDDGAAFAPEARVEFLPQAPRLVASKLLPPPATPLAAAASVESAPKAACGAGCHCHSARAA